MVMVIDPNFCNIFPPSDEFLIGPYCIAWKYDDYNYTIETTDGFELNWPLHHDLLEPYEPPD